VVTVFGDDADGSVNDRLIFLPGPFGHAIPSFLNE
jgi:hypothetical protein